MLTSRAEYRLLLRNDNADQRLSHLGYEKGLLDQETYNKVVAKYNSIQDEKNRLENIYLSANSELAKKYDAFNGPSLLQLLSRPEVDYKDVSSFEFMYELMIQVRLEGYIKKQETEAKKMERLEALKIPKDISYDDVANLATEAKQKFKKVRPETIGQASRISGINPADVNVIELKEVNHSNIEVQRQKETELIMQAIPKGSTVYLCSLQ
uniref:tRNA uridine 5-carboxymethylaminomethyl modification enzyme C-terminal subdomain domain-containing protein n=1 Tax=Biomphalaria glabrata TaxID=6526 RepID=A0A2C9KZX0_BIOGL